MKHHVNPTPVAATSAKEENLSILWQLHSTYLQQLLLSKILVPSHKKTPYLVWDTHTATLNMDITHKPREVRFQNTYSLLFIPIDIHFRKNSNPAKTPWETRHYLSFSNTVFKSYQKWQANSFPPIPFWKYADVIDYIYQ